jgi:hypothetical protein
VTATEAWQKVSRVKNCVNGHDKHSATVVVPYRRLVVGKSKWKEYDEDSS